MSALRPADLAGKWYPASQEECSRFLLEIPSPSPPPHLPESRWGAIVPHAGWTYSGALAEQTLRALKETNSDPDLAIVFGGHLAKRDRPRIFLEGGWSTPFGDLPIAEGVAQDVSMAVESELETPDDYFDDNAIEVLMPIIKYHWPKVQVVAIGVPPTDEAGNLGVETLDLARRRGFKRPICIGSTDLTHYGPNYDFRPQGSGHRALEWVKTKNDPEIIVPMEKIDAGKVVWVAERSRNACCPGAAAACLAACGKLGAKRGVTIGYTTSFDVHPRENMPQSFVGYVGMILGA